MDLNHLMENFEASGAMQFLKQKSVKNINRGRALVYTLESLPLPYLHKLVSGEERQVPTLEQQKLVVGKVEELLEQDAKDFAELNLPLSLIGFEGPLTHSSRYMSLLADSVKSFWRRRKKQTQVFSKKVKNLEDFPKYYRQNFHHQTDGYLSEESAQLYEHQVELLFRGLADPMRRRLLRPLLKKFKSQRKIKILEIGCGTGTFTHSLAEVFPRAQITAIDMSPQYISFAKKRFIHRQNVDFLVGGAEDLPFADEKFDVVVSVFLHHELPPKVREKVMNESLRVCKPKGFWSLLDSLQLDDEPELNWGLENFPKNFHEPFYKNYIHSPLEPILEKLSPERKFKTETHLLSKLIYSK